MGSRPVHSKFRPIIVLLPAAAKQVAEGSAGRKLFFAGRLGLQLDVVFAPDLVDQLQLRLEEIDVLLFAFQDMR